MNDAVNHPSHYNQGAIEVIDFIEDRQFNFNVGNAVKYICRAPYKGKCIEDLEKAIFYLKRELNRSEWCSSVDAKRDIDIVDFVKHLPSPLKVAVKFIDIKQYNIAIEMVKEYIDVNMEE